jgi:hypothetical protein
MDQLTGKQLLDKIKELGAVTKAEVARACGYVTVKKDGAERLQYNAFHEAIMAAKGIEFVPSTAAKAGRKLSYKAVVQKSGNLIISRGYTIANGAEEGHEFKIELLEDGAFKLSPIYEDEEAEAPAEEPVAA